jgi:hypothetical protein
VVPELGEHRQKHRAEAHSGPVGLSDRLDHTRCRWFLPKRPPKNRKTLTINLDEIAEGFRRLKDAPCESNFCTTFTWSNIVANMIVIIPATTTATIPPAANVS